MTCQRQGCCLLSCLHACLSLTRHLTCVQVRDMPDGEQLWIAKPSLTNQALAVVVFDRVDQLRAALEAAPQLHEWVLQR